ncbi:MAG: TRAP transporter small permease [Thermincola sp.]|jgi:TRAP-type C4-dicarboxylate transport system permease small subunit|nr:TRAP transporter small permease [Thermincola sp.]MDT3701819.1 TRAP transporter small permease [Thermincola sp.]
MNKFVEKASHFMDILARAAVAAIMFTTTLNVIMRLFGSSLRGSVEIVQYLTALGIGLALAYCGFHGGHIAVTFFTDKLPFKAQQFVIVLVEILVAGFLGMTAWQMLLYGQGMQEKNEIALTLGFPIHPIVYLVTVGIVVFLLVVLNNLVKVTKGLFSAAPTVKAADNISVDDLISQ